MESRSNHFSSSSYETLDVEDFETSFTTSSRSSCCCNSPSIFKMPPVLWLRALRRRWLDYFALRVLTIASGTFGVLTLFVAIAHYSQLRSVELREDVHQARCEDEDLAKASEYAICQTFVTWLVCSVTGMAVSLLQLILALLFFCCRSLLHRPNLWCAWHSLVFLCLLPATIMTISNKNAISSDENLPSLVSFKSFNWFVSLGFFNSLGSIAAVGFAACFYGMEGHEMYYSQLTT